MKPKYVFKFAAPLDHYTADVFALRCFDNRFWKTFKRFLKFLGLGHIDPESVAGGAKVFSSPEKASDRNFMLRELEKSRRLHHTKKVMLYTHHDCGAYGGFTRFGGDRDKELEFHKSEHAKACTLLRKHFPDLKVETYFIDEVGIIRTN